MISRNGRKFAFKAPPDLRLKVVRRIEDEGGIVEEFHTDPPDWDTLLQEHFNGGEARNETNHTPED